MTSRPAGSWRCPPETILVGVDYGAASARALEIAKFLASAFQAHVRALHAERFEPPPYFTIEQIGRLEEERLAARTTAAEHLAQFAAASAYQVESIVVDQSPVDAILDAERGVDLIVLGTHGRRGPGRWWLGSVAERVARGATVPVLVTHADPAPVREVLERVTLLDDPAGDGLVRQCAAHLAGVGGGSLVEGGPAPLCSAEALQSASLVVMGVKIDRSGWTIADPVARVLTICQRPVLFIPSVSTPWR